MTAGWTNSWLWLDQHEIGVILLVLAISVPWYVIENVRRRGHCKQHIWFTFSLNVIGITMGVYVFVPALVASLAFHPINDEKTLMAAFGAFAVVIFTSINLWRDCRSLLSREVQPKKRSKSKTLVSDE